MMKECPVCGGDCAAANPPPTNCPRELLNELAQLRRDLEAARAEADDWKKRYIAAATSNAEAAEFAYTERDAARAERDALREPVGDDGLAEAIRRAIVAAVLNSSDPRSHGKQVLAAISPHIRAMLAAERRKAIERGIADIEKLRGLTGPTIDRDEASQELWRATCDGFDHAVIILRALAEPERGE